MATRKGILAVINCGRDQGMVASAFGGEERSLVRHMASRDEVRIVREERDWIYATLPDPVLILRDKGRGKITLYMRAGFVVGAMGCEPKRFVGLSEPDARRLARYGKVAVASEVK